MRKVTNQAEEIQNWARQRQAHPVERAPFRPDGEPAQLGFVFGTPPIANESLQPIPWSRFFAIFHLMGLVLVYDGGDYELLKVEHGSKGNFDGKPLQA